MSIYIVTGSRDWTSSNAIRKALLDVQFGQADVLVHGAARGADTIAAVEAMKLGAHVVAVQPNWPWHKNHAGPIRNRLMLDLFPKAKCLLAFPLPQSLGTRDMIKQAISRGMRVEIY